MADHPEPYGNLLAGEKLDLSDTSRPTLVLFYASWCGHCKRLIPAWNTMAPTVSKTQLANIVAVEADTHPNIMSEYGVSGYPTVIMFRGSKSKKEPYKGDRSAESFIKFVSGEAE